MGVDGATADMPTRTADAPFDDTLADIVLLTSDKVQFHVYKVVLSLSSPFFKEMFSLPQPPQGSNPNSPDGSNVIAISENSKAIDKLLRICYPGRGPSFPDFGDVPGVVEAMVKYEIVESAREILLEFIQKEPLRVFSIACRHRWSDIAEKAAKETLRFPLLSVDVEELEHVPTRVYHRLLVYHKACGEAAGLIPKYLRWVDRGSWTWFNCQSLCTTHSSNWYLKDGGAYPVKVWFIDYMDWVANVLKEAPGSDDITKPTLMEPFLLKAYGCATCRPLAYADLTKFASVELTKEVEQATSKVRFE